MEYARPIAGSSYPQPYQLSRSKAFKQKLFTAPEATTFFAHPWEECKRARVRILRGTPTQESALARDMATRLDRLGDMVREDPFIRQLINERLKAALPALVERERHDVSPKIRATVTGWDTQETADRIELSIGRDPQCIRINGTLVGGVGGLLIYSLSHGLFSGANSLIPRRTEGPIRWRGRLADRRVRTCIWAPNRPS